MKILIGCEESQAITIEFRKLGFEAYSCDIQECSGGHPEWHFNFDVFKAIDGGKLTTESGVEVSIEKWEAAIYHPDCTFITNSGVRWLYEKDGRQNTQRWFSLIDAMIFFNRLKEKSLRNGIFHFALENPIPHKYAVEGIADKKGISKYHQLIQPYQFGHTEKKATCLWLYGFPELKHTNNVYEEMMLLPYAERSKIHYASPGKNRKKIRSKTYSGIAEAIATQWGAFLLNIQTKN